MSSTRRHRLHRRGRQRVQVGLVVALLSLSALPFVLTVTQGLSEETRAERLAAMPWLAARLSWYLKRVEPVQELRPLRNFPSAWEGRWLDVDKNYAQFEKWFGDRVAFRDLMIRSKNELDYRLFRSSTRVYFGEGEEVFGRQLMDFELAATERELDTPEKRAAVHRGVVRYTEQLAAKGVTVVFVAPVQKQYLSTENLPFFAPRLAQPSNFKALHDTMKNDPALHFVDALGILQAHQGQFPLYFRQDFHWTNLSALAVSTEIMHLIARLEGVPGPEDHKLSFEPRPFVGSDARFAALLSEAELMEPELIATWQTRHVNNPGQPGFEFETDTLDDPALLPPVCLFGNSFSDGFLVAGLPDHFQKLTKLDRALELARVPELIDGRCKYLIVQVLDLQAAHWAAFGR